MFTYTEKKDIFGNTALHYAALYGNLEVFNILKEN